MTNAKEELEEELKEVNKTIEDIKAIIVLFGYASDKREILKTSDKLDSLDILDFDYDEGYGGQELFGTVLFNDGSWLTRGEYDGSEWWDYNRMPTVQEVLDFGPSAW